MTPLTLILVHFLVAVNGAAYPAPTLAARLDNRQGGDVSTIWSPFVVGTTVSYGSFGYSSETVTTAGNNWNWCSVGFLDCYVMTTCEFGTIFFPGTSYVCPSTAARCGTEYLYSTLGADLDLTRFACYDTTGANTETFLLESPTAGSTSTTPSSTSTSSLMSSTPIRTSTPTTTPTPLPKPIGAIVGGVVGGLAVLALALLAILLLFRRRNQQPAPMQSDFAATELIKRQHSKQQSPPVAPYNPKYASYASSSPTSPNFPLPIYQHTAGQNEAAYTSQGVPPTQEPVNTADSYARNLSHSPVGAGMQTASYRPQYGNTQPATMPGPVELSPYTAATLRATELNGGQAQR